MTPPARSPLFRRVLKTLLFALRGNGPAKARWLARTDAPLHFDYRRASLPDLQAAHAAATWAGVDVMGPRIQSSALGLELRAGGIASTCHASLVNIRQAGGELRDDAGAIDATVAGIALRLTTEEEVNIVHEIFVDGCYDLQMSGQWNVLDIGANVGIASLHFASRPWVSKVWSFEPFPDTYRAFEENLGRNTALARKITLMRFGLGDHEEMLSVEYRPDLKGSMTLDGLGAWRDDAAGRPTKTVNVKVQSAAATVQSLLPDLSARKTLAKIDCEGSEYPILDSLEAAGLLSKLDAIIMEWHDREPSGLVRQLASNGFDVNLRNFCPDRRFGLLVAWRRS